MTDNMIYRIPPLQKAIVEAVNNENLAVFIGAGVSRLIGCMGWDQLAKNLVNRCFSTRKNGSSCINFKEKDTLSQNNDHKKTITICHQILKQNGFEDIFYEELEKSFKPDDELPKSRNIYDELFGIRGLFITTNADQHFDDKFNPQQIVFKKEDINPSNIDRTKLYHIHGSILDKSSLIFTVREYIQRYNHSQFKKFLKKIFDEYVVLFVGYGMSEFELLDFLITKFDPNKGKELRHFVLLPFYSGEENILEFEQYYYNSMGISVLGYEKDERGYGQLYEIIKSWNSEINQTSHYLYDSYKEIEDVANDYEKDRADRILQIIKNDRPQEVHLFRKLASCSAPFPWLKLLKEKGYFDPKKNPPPQRVSGREGYIIPSWNVLDYLENVATQNAKRPSDEITELLLDIIDSISDYRNEAGERIDNYRTDWIIVKIILALPLEKMTPEHIDFFGASLRSEWDTGLVDGEIGETVLPKLINNEAKELLLKLMDVILQYRKTDQETTNEYASVMDKFWLNEALKKHKPAIAKLCGIEAAEVALNKMLTITDEEKSQFNTIWIPTIEDHLQTSFPDRYECQLVHFARDMFELADPNQIKEKIEELLKREHPIFKRIALHTINYHYKDLNNLFWNWKGNPLDESPLKHELYELLKAHCSSFTEEQIGKVLYWIESKDYGVSEIKDDKDRIEKILAYRKREWLSALLESKDSDVISSYEKYQKIYPAELDHPGLDFWSEGLTGTISPIEPGDLLEKSNAEIAEYLNTYRGEGGWKTPSREGLSDTFRAFVSENPEQFSNDLEPFQSVHRIYQHALLGGLSEAWRAKKDFPWDGILNLMSKITDQDAFWNEKYEKDSYNYRIWIISRIADLIAEGTRDDEHAFDANLLTRAEKILLILVEKTKSTLSESEMTDLLTSVLNSSKGKIFAAMVNLSLRSARLSKEVQGGRWVEAIKTDFDKRLSREIEPSLEFSVTLGEYLTRLCYLDEKWVTNNINRIFPKHDDTHWRAAFTGYLFYSRVYTDLYFLLRENGHYTKALQTDFAGGHVTERLVQHICIGYLEDWEKLDDDTSLISQLLTRGNADQLSEIVNYFWMQRDRLTDRIKEKVKPLWEVLFEELSKNKEDPEYQEIISNISKWLSLIDEIDEQTLKWLKLSARYAQIGYNASHFIEYLLNHAPKTPKEVGDIYLEILNAGAYPTYKEDNIQAIVRILYEQSQREAADKICILYGAKHFDFLRTIYEEHRGKMRE